jgi:hypothetical protein
MNQPEITDAKEFEIDPRGQKTRKEAEQEQESKKASEASQPIPGDKLSPWKFPRKED